jgi:hypothetical protein
MSPSYPEVAMTRRGLAHSQQPPRLGRVPWLSERLSERDWLIIETVNQLRLVHGIQLERLHFHELTARGRVVSRGKALRRLVDWQVLTHLDRRIGGSPRGSSGFIYGLGNAGRRLLRERPNDKGVAPRIRPGLPGERMVRHTLAIAETYVGLVERCRSQAVQLVTFEAEKPVPNGLGGFVTPDAYVVLEGGHVRDYWWIEVDRGTEGDAQVRAKMFSYLDLLHRGQLGPDGVLPRVLVTVLDDRGLIRLRRILSRLPSPADELFTVALQEEATALLVTTLLTPDEANTHA